MPDLDYVTLVGRFGIVVGDGADVDDEPDVIWCNEGDIRLVPLNGEVKIAAGSPVPWTGGIAVIDATIDTNGYLSWRGKQFVQLVDLTSDKVNPTIPANKATHRVEFRNVKADSVPVTFTSATVRIAADTVDILTGTCDLTKLLPVQTGNPTPIYSGPRGTGITDIVQPTPTTMALELSDGTTTDPITLPAGPGGSDAGVAGYVTTPGSATEVAVAAKIGPVASAAFGTVIASLDTAASGATNRAALAAAATAAMDTGYTLIIKPGEYEYAGDEIVVDRKLTAITTGAIIHQSTKARGVFDVSAPDCTFLDFGVRGAGLDVTGYPLNGADSFRRHVGIRVRLSAHRIQIDNARGRDIMSIVAIGDYWPGETPTYSATTLQNPSITNIDAHNVWVAVVGGPVSDPFIDHVAGDWAYCFGAPTNGDPNSPPHLVYISSDTAHPSSGGSYSRIAGSGVSAAGGALKLKHMSGAQVDVVTARNCKGLAEFEEVTDSKISGLSSTGETYPTTGDNRGAIWMVNCQRLKFTDPSITFANTDHGLGIWMNSQCADIELIRPRIVANRLTASTTVYGIRGTGPGLIIRDPFFDSKGAAIQAGAYLEGADSRVSNPVAAGAIVYPVYARTGRQLVDYDSLSLLPSRSVAGSRAIGVHADATAGGSAFRDRAVGQPAVIGFADTFDRADVQTLGHTDNLRPWRYIGLAGEFNGTWQITSNAAQYAGGSARGLAVVDGGKADGVLTAVVGSLPVTAADGWVLRATDTSNYIALLIDPATGRPVLQKRVAGSPTTVYSGGAGTEIAAGDSVAITLAGTSVSVTRNGTSIVPAQTISDVPTSNLHGLLGVTGGTSTKTASIAFA